LIRRSGQSRQGGTIGDEQDKNAGFGQADGGKAGFHDRFQMCEASP
jgi:hypothetical protein